MTHGRISLATKALGFQVVAVLAIATAVAVPRYFALRDGLYAAIESSAENLLQVLEDLVTEHPDLLRPGALDAVVDRFGHKLPAVARVSMIAPDARIIADSRLEVGHLTDDSSSLPLLREVGRRRTYFTADGQSFLRYMRSLRGRYDPVRQSDIAGVASVDMRLAPTDATVRRELAAEMALVIVLLFPIGALLYVAMRRTFVGPLEQLAAAGAQFARGDVPAPLAFSGRDELAGVAQTFNEMVEARTRAFTETQEQLTASVAEVKVLQGILPICATCKRIRGEDGAWEAVESYVRDHTNAEFTHALCPDCAQRDWGRGVPKP